MNKTYLKLSLDLDFVLIAITAPLKDYTLCHKINKNLEFDLEKIDDHEVYYNVDEAPLAFSRYHFFVDEGEIDYYLVNNRNSEGFLIPEMNKVDFFVIIQQFIGRDELDFILNRLNKLPDIQVAAQINPLKLKSKENLVM
ncbi:MAG: IPExxxVDY family protein [Pedobacter sp.]|nr:IPExxxVDY family protein [Pedobacter sp.]